jgi:hypothetical protein
LHVSADAETLQILNRATTTTGAAFLKFTNLGGNYYIGPDSSAGNRGFIAGGAPYGLVLNVENAYPIVFGTSNIERARIDSSGRLLVGTNSGNANGGILQLSSGITFPATAVAASDANTLDDYEEGTFTPAMTSGSGGPITLSTATGQYTKIGNVVNFRLRVGVSNANAAGGLITITGLPFTVSSAIAHRTRVVSASIDNVTGSTMDSVGGAYAGSGTSSISILTSLGGNVVLTNTSEMDFNGTYFV